MNENRQVIKYYTEKRDNGGDLKSIYEIWEEGGAFGDSVTPSTYNHEYRSHAALKMSFLTERSDLIVSMGCGNAMVEGDLVRVGRKVHAMDINPEAVELARCKGAHAIRSDFYDLSPDFSANAKLYYADGFLGHLFDGRSGLDLFFAKIESLAPREGSYLLVSNDAPKTDRPFQCHETVDGFWFLSRDYLSGAAAKAGWHVLESYYFPYVRPVSGLRNRSILLAQYKRVPMN